MKNILKAPFIKEIGEIANNMYRQGWNERNGGNISVLLSEKEVAPYINKNKIIRDLPINSEFKNFAGQYFLITGTGKYFKNFAKDPERNLGIIRIAEDGKRAHLLWGFSDGGTFTSEVAMHLGAHRERLKIDPNHRVVLHAHPTCTVSMTHIHSLDEKEFTKSIWSTCTECIVIFPDGIGVLPWMVSSGAEIGKVSAEKFKEYRILVWALHGCTVTGTSLDEAFGLLETVEKGAAIYNNIWQCKERKSIDDDMLMAICNDFNIKPKEGWLCPTI